ncbi:MAG: choline monooxygenase, partial [Frankiaceae bacterium]|nr:choline monooxygenase [Frankiaceae bacterium]
MSTVHDPSSGTPPVPPGTTPASANAAASANVIVAGPLDGRDRPASILPARAYTGQAEYDAEMEAVFASGWVWAGYEHWLPAGGDVKPITIAGRPLLLIRDGEGTLRAFHNACRHRGMALTEEPVQVTQRLQCAYHCWSYNLDGSLAVTPYAQRERRSTLDPQMRAQLGLLPVRCTTWAGMVFVCLSDGAPEFDAVVEPLQRRWAHIDFSRLYLAEERSFDIPANWKLVVENFLDFYHLPFIHPQVGSVAASLDVDDVVLSDDLIGGSYPRGATGKAKKSEDALPWLGDVPEQQRDSQDIFCVFPNALVFLESDWFQVIGYEPLAPDRTLEHMAVFVDRGAADEAFAASRKELCDKLYEVNGQDLPILRRLQSGRRSPGADLTYLLPHWDQVTAHFQEQVRRRVGYP